MDQQFTNRKRFKDQNLDINKKNDLRFFLCFFFQDYLLHLCKLHKFFEVQCYIGVSMAYRLLIIFYLHIESMSSEFLEANRFKI